MNNFFSKSKQQWRRLSASALLIIFATISLGGALMVNVKPMQAQEEAAVAPAPAIPAVITEDIPAKIKSITEKIKQGIQKGLVIGLMRMTSYFMEKVAKDVATYAASGGKGQGAAFFKDGFGSYLSNTASDAAATFVEELGSATGIDICHPPDLNIDLKIRIGLHGAAGLDGGPKCKLSDIKKNWSADALSSKYGGLVPTNKNDLAKKMQGMVQADESDVGFSMESSVKLGENTQKATTGATLARNEGQGVKPMEGAISGKITNPAQTLKETIAKDTKNNPTAGAEQTQAQLNAALASGMTDLFPFTAVVFINTFLTQVLQNFMSGGTLFGICVTGDCGDESGSNANDNLTNSQSAGLAAVGRADIERAITKALKANPTPVNDYDLTAQLFNCPDDSGTYNCAADDGMLKAVQQANLGVPMTVQQALDQDFLHKNWKLIPPSRQENESTKSCDTAYCYANLKVLRQARILPIGFEMAAAAVGRDEEAKLGDVVAAFNVPGSKYYHLIDPNWVLKLPVSRCRNEAYTAVPLAGGAARLQECVDLQSCVGFDSSGNCYAWGYCTREKNVWRFGLDSCDPQYRTCKAFTNSAGQSVSYLYRTLDTGNCTAENSGCTGYSLYKNINNQWVKPSTKLNSFQNTGIYLNSKVQTNCSSGSAGCSAFSALDSASNIVANLTLKKAPDYLKCYDANSTTDVVEYPQTRSDLARITDYLSATTTKWKKDACSAYAGICIPDEVGCNWYNSVNGLEDSIPGKFKPAEFDANNTLTAWNDQCDKQCVGYDAYKEMESNYANGADPVYILPSSGKECAAADAGCTGFTNLETATGGVENVEYFSYLRPCIKTDTQKQKTFYTYEGSDTSGYQLKGYLLEVDNINNYTLADETAGGPKYFYRVQGDLANYKNICSKSKYQDGTADTDCRQFNDDAGKIYYRLMSKTIAVSDQCTSYRLNETDMYASSTMSTADCNVSNGGVMIDNSCRFCFNGGAYRDGYCTYLGLPDGANHNAGVSSACSKEAESCRAYKGNTGNSVQTLLSYDFEIASKVSEWKAYLAGGSTNGIVMSGESTKVGGHSLKFAPIAANDFISSPSVNVSADKVYVLSFWAKGQGLTANTSIKISASLDTSTPIEALVNDNWKNYQLRIITKNDGTNISLKMVVDSGGVLYIDNLRLTELRDVLYLVKNSLSVPTICDSNPNDNLPGEALGCRAFKDVKSKEYDLTNFSYLCREEAIGCTALVDTHNSESEKPQIFNVWLGGVGGQKITTNIFTNVSSSCKIPNGGNGCYVNAQSATTTPSAIAAGFFGTSTIFIPGDNPTSSPIYLVANERAACNAADLGCVQAGKQIDGAATTTFATMLIKNLPDDYSNILCTKEAVGCQTFGSGGGSYYFKDPPTVGAKLCEYKNNVTDLPNDTLLRGWFWTGVGVCSSTVAGTKPFCSKDSDCIAALGDASSTCTNIGSQPCYSENRLGNYYGIYSYGNTSTYKNFVGTCPSEQSGCTKFVDNNDTQKFTNAIEMPKAYYLIDNEKLRDSESSCSGQAGLKAGCVIMDKTDNPSKYWSTTSTYNLSDSKGGAAVAPVDSSGSIGNNSNIILKAIRDRECGQWIYCNQQFNYFNPDTSQSESKCYNVGVCDSASPELNPAQCINDRTNNGEEWGQGKLLTTPIYKDRNISWSGLEYSGYSLPFQFQIPDMRGFRGPDDQYYLAGKVDNDVPPGAVNGNWCGSAMPEDLYGRGLTLDRQCYYPVNGVLPQRTSDFSIEFGKQKLSCRGYPREDSPYPRDIFAAGVSKKTPWMNANSCFGGDCECDFVERDYGGAKIFTGIGAQKVYGKKCIGVADPTLAWCNNNANTQACIDAGGTCSPLQQTTHSYGWRGYCAESDMRTAVNGTTDKKCLTWLPLDLVSGALDIFNQDDTANANDILESVMSNDRAMCLYNQLPIPGVGERAGWWSDGQDRDTINGGGMVEYLSFFLWQIKDCYIRAYDDPFNQTSARWNRCSDNVKGTMPGSRQCNVFSSNLTDNIPWTNYQVINKNEFGQETAGLRVTANRPGFSFYPSPHHDLSNPGTTLPLNSLNTPVYQKWSAVTTGVSIQCTPSIPGAEKTKIFNTHVTGNMWPTFDNQSVDWGWQNPTGKVNDGVYCAKNENIIDIEGNDPSGVYFHDKIGLTGCEERMCMSLCEQGGDPNNSSIFVQSFYKVNKKDIERLEVVLSDVAYDNGSEGLLENITPSIIIFDQKELTSPGFNDRNVSLVKLDASYYRFYIGNPGDNSWYFVSANNANKNNSKFANNIYRFQEQVNGGFQMGSKHFFTKDDKDNNMYRGQIAIKVAFDTDDNLRGVGVGLVGWFGPSDGLDGLSFFPMIYTKMGKCAAVAQLTNIASTDKSVKDFPYKPVAWRMKTGIFEKSHIIDYALASSNWPIIGTYYILSDRKTNFIFPDYGLISPDESPTSTEIRVVPDIKATTRKCGNYNRGGDFYTIYNEALSTGWWTCNWSLIKDPYKIYDQLTSLVKGPGDDTSRYDAYNNRYTGGVPMVLRWTQNVIDGSPPYDYNTEILAAAKQALTTNIAAKAWGSDGRVLVDVSSEVIGSAPPVVAAVNYCNGSPCNSDKQIMSLQARGITVNGTSTGNQYFSIVGQATVQFYAYAHPNQMPLRRIMVDFGNDDVTKINYTLNGSMPNFFPNCSGDVRAYFKTLYCPPGYTCGGYLAWNDNEDFSPKTKYNGFGFTKGKGCVPRYYEAVGSYVCDLSKYVDSNTGNFNWDRLCREHPEQVMENTTVNPACQGNSTVSPTKPFITKLGMFGTSANEAEEKKNGLKGLADGMPICVFTPRAQVLDNWGWCNCGSLNGSDCKKNDSGQTNYGSFYDDGFDRFGNFNLSLGCNVGHNDAWQPYGGKIVVVPFLTGASGGSQKNRDSDDQQQLLEEAMD